MHIGGACARRMASRSQWRGRSCSGAGADAAEAAGRRVDCRTHGYRPSRRRAPPARGSLPRPGFHAPDRPRNSGDAPPRCRARSSSRGRARSAIVELDHGPAPAPAPVDLRCAVWSTRQNIEHDRQVHAMRARFGGVAHAQGRSVVCRLRFRKAKAGPSPHEGCVRARGACRDFHARS